MAIFAERRAFFVVLSGILLGVFVICTLLAPALGNTAASGSAVMEGAGAAVEFCLSLAGGVCLWSGVLEVMERCGLTDKLAGFLSPPLRRLFPRSARDGAVLSALSENVSANLLGLGNAATPAGLRAARGMARLAGAEDELCLLVVLNTASIQLLPTTIASVRAAAGAASAFDILPAVWFSSVLSVCAGMFAAGLLKRLWR